MYIVINISEFTYRTCETLYNNDSYRSLPACLPASRILYYCYYYRFAERLAAEHACSTWRSDILLFFRLVYDHCYIIYSICTALQYKLPTIATQVKWSGIRRQTDSPPPPDVRAKPSAAVYQPLARTHRRRYIIFSYYRPYTSIIDVHRSFSEILYQNTRNERFLPRPTACVCLTRHAVRMDGTRALMIFTHSLTAVLIVLNRYIHTYISIVHNVVITLVRKFYVHQINYYIRAQTQLR